MDIIKFKAINRYTKEIHYNPYNGKIGGINDMFTNTGDWDYFQFIDVIDDKGYEIYNSDIVKILSNPIFVGEVIKRFGAYGVENKGHGRYFIDISEPIEVIGQIKINPEILEVTNPASHCRT